MHFFNKKLYIHKSFFIFLFFLMAIKKLDEFIVVFIFITIHELVHIFAACLLKAEFKSFTITLLGEWGTIDKIHNLSTKKKIIIYGSAPLFNFLICMIVSLSPYRQELYSIFLVNMALGLFNMIPILNLDGGKILYLILGNIIGVINSIRILTRLSKAMCILLFLLGILQIALYPFNFSLIAISLFLMYHNRSLAALLITEFFLELQQKEAMQKTTGMMSNKNITVSEKILIKDMLNLLTWDHFYIISIIETLRVLHEKEFVNYITENGINGTIENIFQDQLNHSL